MRKQRHKQRVHIVLFHFFLLNFIRIGLFSFKGLDGKEKIQSSKDIYGKFLVMHKTFITKITTCVGGWLHLTL